MKLCTQATTTSYLTLYCARSYFLYNMQCIDRQGNPFIGLIRVRTILAQTGNYLSTVLSIFPLPVSRHVNNYLAGYDWPFSEASSTAASSSNNSNSDIVLCFEPFSPSAAPSPSVLGWAMRGENDSERSAGFPGEEGLPMQPPEAPSSQVYWPIQALSDSQGHSQHTAYNMTAGKW